MFVGTVPANTRRWHNVGSMLAHRLRRRANSEPPLVQRLVFAGVCIIWVGGFWGNTTCVFRRLSEVQSEFGCVVVIGGARTR